MEPTVTIGGVNKDYLRSVDDLIAVVEKRIRLMSGAESADMDFMRALLANLKLQKLFAGLVDKELRRVDMRK